jgi:L-lactate dehydrogenase complex protein LldG
MTDTSDMRALIQKRIRAALADVPADEQPGDVAVPREYRTSRHGDGAPHARQHTRLVDLFMERARDHRAEVFRSTDSAASGLIADLLTRQGISKLVVPPGFPDSYLSGAEHQALLRDDPPLSVAALDAAHGVITTCADAVADTGTIILDAGPGQGRRGLTLLPDYHLCLIRAGEIAASVPDAIRRLDPGRPLTLISGPSATSDIENTRIEGVHGPRTLHIIVIEPELEHGTDPL